MRRISGVGHGHPAGRVDEERPATGELLTALVIQNAIVIYGGQPVG